MVPSGGGETQALTAARGNRSDRLGEELGHRAPTAGVFLNGGTGQLIPRGTATARGAPSLTQSTGSSSGSCSRSNSVGSARVRRILTSVLSGTSSPSSLNS